MFGWTYRGFQPRPKRNDYETDEDFKDALVLYDEIGLLWTEAVIRTK